MNTPNALDGNEISRCNTSSAVYQSETAGNVDSMGEDDADVLASIRDLLSYLPMNNEDDASFDECFDDLNRENEVLAS